MDKSCSRGKRLVTLALNKDFAKKVAEIKQGSKSLSSTLNEMDSDSEYNPSSSQETSDSEVENVPKKINIISNIVAPSTAAINNDAQNISSENSSNFISTFTVVGEIVDEIINSACDQSQTRTNFNMYTKSGELRKRKRFETSVSERKRQKLEVRKNEHTFKPSCKSTCKKKCNNKISYERRLDINLQYWNMTPTEQNTFLLNTIERSTVTRRTTTDSRRSQTNSYRLKDAAGIKMDVCKVFFLSTLGYEPHNDRKIRDALTKSNESLLKAQPSKKGCNTPKNKIDRTVVIQHIETFHPTVSHYRREHAPNRKYLPSDISITLMYNDFKEKHPNIKFSYYLYRSVVSAMNISFANLGHEECFACETYTMHKNLSTHDAENLDPDCESCKSWKNHIEAVKLAREQYRLDSEVNDASVLVCSADLQKVIMLPRCDMFKEVIFVGRIIAFNESFVPLGKKQKQLPTAVIWNEAIAGRSKEDIISSFYAFFLNNRDIETIILWLDNCSAQNKNWALFCFFVYIINTEEVALKSLSVKYFEPGHTFMSADSFHHQVEQSLKNPPPGGTVIKKEEEGVQL